MQNLRHRPWPDAICLLILLSATGLLIWNRAAFDIWIARHDNLTAYLPWYSLLGERLRAGEIPGWNPYMFSGTPFAADPQSGWMYLPAMIPFTLFDSVTAMTVKLGIELVVAGLATYAFIRVLGYAPVSALGGSALYVFGPLSFQTAYCCTVRSHVSAWLPLTLLGAELALRSKTRLGRLTAIGIGGFGFSQILAGWLGQGALNAALVIGAFCFFRVFSFSQTQLRAWRSSSLVAIRGILTALGIGLFGAALNAAALWPRLVVNAETNLSAARYKDLPSGYDYPPYEFTQLVSSLLADAFVHRRMTIPAAGAALLLMVSIRAPRSSSVPFFAGLTIATFLLSMSLFPLYDLFGLIPFWDDLHDHYPAQATATIMIGPAVLTAAAINSLPALASRNRTFLSIAIPVAVLAIAFAWLLTRDEVPSGLAAPGVTLAITGVLIALMMLSRSSRFIRLGQSLLVLLILVEPLGLELIGSVSRWDPVPGWEDQWNPNDSSHASIDTYASPTDPTGAGEFLQEQLILHGPFRFAGYGGITYPGQKQANIPYTNRRTQPEVAAMLVNGRSMALHIYDMQGYNPVQLSRYTDYIYALNTVPQDYHLANLRPQGIGSPLLNALNVRYVLVDARIPSDRDDVLALSQGHPPVFETPLVRVYENRNVLPHAWIVHEAITATRDEAIARLTARDIDLTTTALVETNNIQIAPAIDPSTESTAVTSYEPERIEIQATVSSNALLVVSEIVESGWKATVDGRDVEIIPTNIALRGVWLGPGPHSIVFTYEPATLRYGLIISAVAHIVLILLLVASAIHWWQNRNQITPPQLTTDPGPT